MLKNLGLTDTHKVIQGSYNVLVCCRDGVALVTFSYRRVGGGGRGRVGKWEASNHPPLPYFPHFLHILSSRPSLPGPPPSSNLLCSSSSLLLLAFPSHPSVTCPTRGRSQCRARRRWSAQGPDRRPGGRMALVGLRLVLLFLVGDSAGNGHQWAWQPRKAEKLPGGGGSHRFSAFWLRSSVEGGLANDSTHPLLAVPGLPRGGCLRTRTWGCARVTFWSHSVVAWAFLVTLLPALSPLKQIFWSPGSGIGFLCTRGLTEPWQKMYRNQELWMPSVPGTLGPMRKGPQASQTWHPLSNEVKMVTSSGKLCIYYPEQQRKRISWIFELFLWLWGSFSQENWFFYFLNTVKEERGNGPQMMEGYGAKS